VKERYRPREEPNDWVTPTQQFWDRWHAEEKFREQFVIRKFNNRWFMRRRVKRPLPCKIEPADDTVLLAFALLQKWPARTHSLLWRRLIKYLLSLPHPDSTEPA